MILNNSILLVYAQCMDQAIVPDNKPLPVVFVVVILINISKLDLEKFIFYYRLWMMFCYKYLVND